MTVASSEEADLQPFPVVQGARGVQADRLVERLLRFDEASTHAEQFRAQAMKRIIGRIGLLQLADHDKRFVHAPQGVQ